jgi:TonB family protein
MLPLLRICGSAVRIPPAFPRGAQVFGSGRDFLSERLTSKNLRTFAGMVRAAAILATGLLLLGACAARSASSPFLHPGSAPEGRQCFLDPAPAQLPSVTQLIDSARVRDFLAREAELRGSIVVTIGYDSLTAPGATLPVIDATNVSGGTVPALADSLKIAVRETLPLPATASAGQTRWQGWSVLLRIDLGPPLTMRVGKTELCPPDLLNSDALGAKIGPLWHQLLRTRTDLPEQMTIDVTMVTDTAGTVQTATVGRSSGIADVDRLAQSVALHAQFLPALRNRKRIPVRVLIPFMLNARIQPSEPTDCVPTPARRCR